MMNFKFTKCGEMIYISHLDLMRLLVRAMRRAGFALKLTQGFSPHPKLSIKRALKLGLSSEDEEASILLARGISPEDFLIRLNRQLPVGIRINSAELLNK